MIPSARSTTTTTAEQIDQAVASYRALLEKYSQEFDAEAVQRVLNERELAVEQFAVFQRRVQAISQFGRRVKPNRTRTGQEVLAATGRKQDIHSTIVSSMPRGEGDEVEVVFFKPDLSERRYLSDDEVEQEFALRGLMPADPYSVAAINEADPAFADKMPHVTHWKNMNGAWCYMTFYRRAGIRCVNVSFSGIGYRWGANWWFAGLRK